MALAQWDYSYTGLFVSLVGRIWNGFLRIKMALTSSCSNEQEISLSLENVLDCGLKP